MELIFLILLLLPFKVLLYYTKFLRNGSPFYSSGSHNLRDYNFFIEADYGQIVEIELINITSNISDANPYCYFELTEYKGLPNNYLVGYDSHDKFNLNRLILTFGIQSQKCIYLGFIVKPSSTITKFSIKVTVETFPDWTYYTESDSPSEVGMMYNNLVYKFYVPAQYDQSVDIKLTRKNKITQEQNIKCYEYLEKNSRAELEKKKSILQFNSDKKYFTYSYRLTNLNATYFAFEMKPSHLMEDVEVILTVISPKTFEYDLEDGKKTKIENLSTKNTYRYYIKVKNGYGMDITIYKKKDSSILLSIPFYEYLNRTSKNFLTKKNINFVRGHNYEETYYFYIISNPSTNILLLEIKPDNENEYIWQSFSLSIKTRYIPPDFEYNLTSGITQYLENLSSLYIYKFYIPAKHEEKVEIEFTSEDKFNTDKDQKITFYEYYERERKDDLHTKSENLVYNFYHNSYLSFISLDNNYDFSVQYLAFEIKPNFNMTSINVTATIPGKIINIKNGQQLYFQALYKESIYRFSLDCEYTDYLVFELTKTYNLHLEDIRLNFLEYKSKDEKETKKTRDYFIYDVLSKSFKIIYAIQDILSNYLLIELEMSDYYLFSVNLKANIIKYNSKIDLIYESSKFIQYLINNLPYRFYVKAKYQQKIYLEFDVSSSYISKKQLLNVIEYSDNNSKKKLSNITKEFYTVDSYSFSIDKLYLKEPYIVSKPKTNYIAFEIRPLCDLKSIIVNSAVKENYPEFDANEGSSTYLGYIKANQMIIINLYTRFNTTLNIEFRKNDKEYSKEQSINIYELNHKYSLERLRSRKLELSYDNDKNSYKISYTVMDISTHCISIEFETIHDMKEVNLRINMEDKDYDNDKLYWIILLYGGIGIVAIIFIIIFIKGIIACTNKKNTDIKNIEERARQSLPLIPKN